MLVSRFEAFELALVVETSSATPHLMIYDPLSASRRHKALCPNRQDTLRACLTIPNNGALTSTWFLTDKFESCEVSMSKNQSVSERLSIQMSMATDRRTTLAFTSCSLRSKPSTTKDDVKVAEIIETGKKICTFATNSNDYDTNHRYSFRLPDLRESGLSESSSLSASNSVCTPAQTRAHTEAGQSGLLQTGRLLLFLSEL